MEFWPKDFVETAEGLLFAVLSSLRLYPVGGGGAVRAERVASLVTMLRYQRVDGKLRKLATDEAWRLLRERYPELISRVGMSELEVHAVPPARVTKHHCPRARLKSIRTIGRTESSSSSEDVLERTARKAVSDLVEEGVDESKIGITGSLLIGAHSGTSDVDLVVYDKQSFSTARQWISNCHNLSEDFPRWREAYDKRDCDLSLEEFVRHELRKCNKFWIGETKIDLSFVPLEAQISVEFGEPAFRRVRRVHLGATVTEDQRAFECPARWTVEVNAETTYQLISWTATYIGQAFRGDQIEVKGWLEESPDGEEQIIVGTSREAHGEFIRVTKPAQSGFVPL